MAKFSVASGQQGAQGPIGPAGPQGLKGDKGDTGNTGLKGDTGEKGDTGLTGATGAKGDKGDTGDSGVSSPISYTPILSGVGMAFTSGNGQTGQSGNYLTVGKQCTFSAQIALANVNFATLPKVAANEPNFAITLPVAAAKNGLMAVGYTVKSDGKAYAILGKTTASSNILTLWTNEKLLLAVEKDNPYIFASGSTMSLTGTYQTV